jgi:hypothetical protein
MAGIFDLDLGGLLKGAGSLAKDVATAIRGKEPVDENKLVELSVQLQTVQNVIPTILSQIDVAQAAINQEAAKQNSFFQSGWRPMCGWICTGALVFNFLIAPLISILWPQMVRLDVGELITLLFGMLGLGTLRTLDKKK